MAKLTKRTVDSLVPEARDYTRWDGELRGFGCRVHPQGRKTFIFKYRVGGGRNAAQRKMTLGRYSEAFTVDQARAMANQAHADVLKGKDPAGQRSDHRQADSVDQFAKRYMKDHANTKKKPRSVDMDQWLLDRHILPALGTRKMVDLGSADILKLVNGLSSTPFLANRVRSLLSKMLSLAVAWGVRSDVVNPTRGVEKFPERSRERFLTADELKRLGGVLRSAEAEATEPWQSIAAIRLLLFTGCRRNEVLSLRWEYVNTDNEALLLPDSKTGPKTVYLTAPVMEILAALPRKDGCPFVLPSRFKGNDRHFAGISHVWERIRILAGLEGVRLHDLRHTFASKGTGLNIGLPLIGGLLGHANATTTAKYAHLAHSPTRKAGARIARKLHSELGGGANVIALASRRRPTDTTDRPSETANSATPHQKERKVSVRNVRSVRNSIK